MPSTDATACPAGRERTSSCCGETTFGTGETGADSTGRFPAEVSADGRDAGATVAVVVDAGTVVVVDDDDVVDVVEVVVEVVDVVVVAAFAVPATDAVPFW